MRMLENILSHLTPLLEDSGQNLGSDWFTRLLENIINSIEKTVSIFSNMILQASLRILSMIYVPMAVVGVILYVTKINRYLGRDLIYGALIIAFFAEFILPALL